MDELITVDNNGFVEWLRFYDLRKDILGVKVLYVTENHLKTRELSCHLNIVKFRNANQERKDTESVIGKLIIKRLLIVEG